MEFDISSAFGALVGGTLFPLAFYTLKPQSHIESLFYADIILCMVIGLGLLFGYLGAKRK